MDSFKFVKAEKLLNRSDFVRLSKSGEKIASRSFLVLYSPCKEKQTRLGVTVTKKIGHAPARNRIKRLVREYFRLNKHKITSKYDINIIAKKEIALLSSKEIFLSLEDIFNKLHKKLET